MLILRLSLLLTGLLFACAAPPAPLQSASLPADRFQVPPAAVPAQNPFLAVGGNMHSDAQSSDTTGLAGPASVSGKTTIQTVNLSATCPTILPSGPHLMALCTQWIGQKPAIYLLERTTGKQLAEMTLEKGGLLGGVYAFIDEKQRLVMADNKHQRIIWVAARKQSTDKQNTKWKLEIEQSRSLQQCHSAGCGDVVALMPDWQGHLIFVTAKGLVGSVPRDDKENIDILTLPNERIDNSISTSPQGIAVVTSHALYLLRVEGGQLKQIWRQPYERGPGRKPGQLSWGSGATPTFFGPTGHEYVTITDNAFPLSHLMVYRAGTGQEVCRLPLFDEKSSGSENSSIAIDQSIFVNSSYGYPYPKLPEGAPPSKPEKAPFVGGLLRVDLTPEGTCKVIWQNKLAVSSVPYLSRADGLIYATERQNDSFSAISINAQTGEVVSRKSVGIGQFSDTLQMVGTITAEQRKFQGMMNGFYIESPAKK